MLPGETGVAVLLDERRTGDGESQRSSWARAQQEERVVVSGWVACDGRTRIRVGKGAGIAGRLDEDGDGEGERDLRQSERARAHAFPRMKAGKH